MIKLKFQMLLIFYNSANRETFLHTHTVNAHTQATFTQIKILVKINYFLRFEIKSGFEKWGLKFSLIVFYGMLI